MKPLLPIPGDTFSVKVRSFDDDSEWIRVYTNHNLNGIIMEQGREMLSISAKYIPCFIRALAEAIDKPLGDWLAGACGGSADTGSE